MGSEVERWLASDETVRFEGTAAGWPPLGLPAVALHGALLGAATLVGFSALVAAGTLVSLVVLELVRVAAHRSHVYAITNRRVLVVTGLVRPRHYRGLALDAVRGVSSKGGDPALLTAGRPWVLRGLGQASVAAVREALPEKPWVG